MACFSMRRGFWSARHALRCSSPTLGVVTLQPSTREPGESVRTLLGKPVPFVGRERRTGHARRVLERDRCVADSVARVVLVTGAAGMGKSSLRREWVRRCKLTGAPVTLLSGGADPMSSGAPFGLIVPLLRQACGVVSADNEDDRRRKVLARVERHVDPSDALRVAQFRRSEPHWCAIRLNGVPGHAAARRGASRDSWVIRSVAHGRTWLAAECESSPTIIVLEDLHWGDRSSTDLIDSAVRHLHDKPFMVLAFGAPPDVHEQFPELWRERRPQEFRAGRFVSQGG